jgi:hypothetical protein
MRRVPLNNTPEILNRTTWGSTVLRSISGASEPVNFFSFAIASKVLKSRFLNSLELRDAVQSDPRAAQRSTQ